MSITQAHLTHLAHRLKRQQLGEADVSAPQFNRFFYRQENRKLRRAHSVLAQAGCASTSSQNLIKD